MTFKVCLNKCVWEVLSRSCRYEIGVAPCSEWANHILGSMWHGSLSTTSLIWCNETGQWGRGVSRLGNAALQMTFSWDYTHTHTFAQSFSDVCCHDCRCCMCLSKPTVIIISIRLFLSLPSGGSTQHNDVLSQHLEAHHLPTDTTFAFLNVRRKKKHTKSALPL